MGKNQTPSVVESISFWLLDKEDEEVPTKTRTKKIELIVLIVASNLGIYIYSFSMMLFALTIKLLYKDDSG